ncbi:unnamed protein product [Rotaria socialis]|uniref:Helix-turn-helix domain-containing protein n=1 Tax=Rotaria socialis TaxID=392032 RepID=A0A818WZB3_9BILA|nr:unnamed protein product [Rotaria socialis]
MCLLQSINHNDDKQMRRFRLLVKQRLLELLEFNRHSKIELVDKQNRKIYITYQYVVDFEHYKNILQSYDKCITLTQKGCTETETRSRSVSVMILILTGPYVVPFISDHPRHVFDNIVQTSLRRAIKYSSTFQSFNDERRYIKSTFLYNGYPSSFIDKTFRKFFSGYISSRSFLPFLDNERQFLQMRIELSG